MTENGSEEGLLVMAEPLGLAEEVCRRMVDVVRVVDGAPPRRRPRGGDRGRSTRCWSRRARESASCAN
jgi:hypothetical protein